MKHKCILIVFLLLFSCKSPKQNEENLLIEKEAKQTEQKVAEEFVKQEKEIKSETKSENPEDTLTYLEMLALREREKVKRDSFLAQFDTLYKFIDSTVIVKGIIQSSGLRGTESFGIKAEYQLANPKKRFFLVTNKDLTPFWGKCVSVTGKYVKGWNFESGDSRENFAFGTTAIYLRSIEFTTNDICLNSPIYDPEFQKKYKPFPLDSLYYGSIFRNKRPAPDIDYDYGFELKEPIDLSEDEWKNIKKMPLLINIPLDTLNFIIENKKKVKLYGYISGGYNEGIVFLCQEFKGYE